MASFCTPFTLTRRRIVAFRAIVAAVTFAGAAGVFALITSGCAVSEAHAQSAPQASPMAATSRPAIITASENSSTTQALLHKANTTFHTHDWLSALLAYQQIYYSDPEHGRPDDQGFGSFAQARMSLCHTWTGVNDLDGGDYAAAHDEMQEALDDNPGNAVAQRMIPLIEQQYRLISAVDDINQRFRDVDGSPDVDSALADIRSNAVTDSAKEADLAGGTKNQKIAAFNFLRSYYDAYLTNFSLNAHADLDSGIAAKANDFVPTDQQEDYDQYQMALAIPSVNDLGHFAFADDKFAEVNQYEPVLAENRLEAEAEQFNQLMANLQAQFDETSAKIKEEQQEEHDDDIIVRALNRDY